MMHECCLYEDLEDLKLNITCLEDGSLLSKIKCRLTKLKRWTLICKLSWTSLILKRNIMELST